MGLVVAPQAQNGGSTGVAAAVRQSSASLSSWPVSFFGRSWQDSIRRLLMLGNRLAVHGLLGLILGTGIACGEDDGEDDGGTGTDAGDSGDTGDGGDGDSGSDDGSGGSTDSDDGASSGDSGEDSGSAGWPEAGPYSGPCNYSGDCEGFPELVSCPQEFNFCTLPCQDPSECPPPPNGDAVPVCEVAGGFRLCLLDCSGGEECPTTMTCEGLRCRW